jgi:hypothetical protein
VQLALGPVRLGAAVRPRQRLSSPDNILAGAGNAFARSRTAGESDRNSLVAAGFRVRHADTDSLRRLIMPWQARSFAYYDLLGEIKYASQFYSRMLSPLRLYAAKLDENGDWVEIGQKKAAASDEPPVALSPDDQKAIDALERIQDPGGGREGLLGSYGRLMFLVGECILLCSRDPETEDEQWEMLSTDELRIVGNVMMRFKAPSLNAQEYREPDDDDFEPVDADYAVPYRLWKQHPRYSMWADATMQGVLDLCEELVLLTQAVRARARSRLAGPGILFIDEAITGPAPPEPLPGEDPEEDPYLARLTQAMTLPIVNEGTAGAVVPLLSRVSVPQGKTVKDMVYHLQIMDPTQLYPETGLRQECIHRIAIGLDMPPEELEGKSDANHWTVWMIDEQTWKAHGQPIANQLINDLNASYYRAQLRADGVAEPRSYAIRYDPTAVINHPDRTADAKDLHNMVVIGDKALREATGFDEDAAPTREEQARRIGILTRDSSLAWDGTPSVKAGGVETAPGQIVTPGQPPTEGTGAQSGAEVTAGPPNPETSEAAQGLSAAANGHPPALYKIVGAADLAVLRAREAAGNRLLSLSRRHQDVLGERGIDLSDVKTRDIAAALGPDGVKQLGTTELELVAYASELIRDALRLFGLTDGRIVDLIAEKIETHAARTLYEPSAPLPRTFANYVAGLTVGA